MANKLKSYRINRWMQEDLDFIKATLNVNETTAIWWALEAAKEKIKDDQRKEKLKDEYLLDK